MSIEGILFDFDGVILDSMKYHYRAWRHAFAKSGAKIDEHYFYLQEGQGIEGVGMCLLQAAGLNNKNLEKIMAVKKSYFQRIFRVEFYDGFFNLLDYLSARNFKLGIVTGGARERILPFVKRHIDGFFNTIVTVDDVTHPKPHPEPYLKGAEKLNLSPSDCVVIENAPLGIKSGKKAGMTVIAIQTTLSRQYLKEADYCAASFNEIQDLFTSFL